MQILHLIPVRFPLKGLWFVLLVIICANARLNPVPFAPFLLR